MQNSLSRFIFEDDVKFDDQNWKRRLERRLAEFFEAKKGKREGNDVTPSYVSFFIDIFKDARYYSRKDI